ncbi:transcriptional regulator [Corallincola luteus]|uniref:Transcriptional regulator n=1 Tax=Corallincola luteus TaxID=1775177 RepID=A0ABY2AST4_9GAMM|nr:metalloregulator ArsR/SmtB family transcription factor [Corallincola luteus]TCI05167.1 transcriptional regulator [Corallincola luteus]
MQASADKLLYLLKTRGALTAQQCGEILEMTSMGARKHLQQLAAQALVSYEDIASKKGRPNRFWQLSEKGHARFPDRHADLTLQLIDSVKAVFGDDGLDQLIAKRETELTAAYLAALSDLPLAQRVQKLAALREKEGYMASVQQIENGWLLIEDHCPICAAAQQCQGFCRAELRLFQTCIGEHGTVERTEYLLEGARRCAYQITMKM